MPPLENARHEKFAQGLAQGMSATEAYRQAGYDAKGNAAEVAASRLIRNTKVASRVEELKTRAAASVQISKEWVLEQLVDNLKLAKEQGQLAPANRAAELLGKELGMFVDRSESLNTNVAYVISGEPIEDADEWLAQHRPN
jgi:phage terminase small subunit